MPWSQELGCPASSEQSSRCIRCCPHKPPIYSCLCISSKGTVQMTEYFYYTPHMGNQNATYSSARHARSSPIVVPIGMGRSWGRWVCAWPSPFSKSYSSLHWGAFPYGRGSYSNVTALFSCGKFT
ncbi:hypothetical protein FIBSPDRAFT_78791 [Athelia psychrophila]|uniref:Uncharacterized protein n=1 Tax=Athelia psychrophila TaxID=1759441 RepID=A0A166EDU7_9AGAM|nr:hypothetical protein FIBSPDRAFT_78791 [Fibularhizoctonia sp. CBS 109695]